MLESLSMILWGMVALTIYLNHPLLMALTLVMASLVLGGILGMTLSTWVSVALILIFLGGMMVIFVYFASLVTNEKLTLKSPIYLTTAVMLVFMPANLLTDSPSVNSIALFNFHLVNFVTISLLLAYLLYTLFVVVEMTVNFKGAVELSSF